MWSNLDRREHNLFNIWSRAWEGKGWRTTNSGIVFLIRLLQKILPLDYTSSDSNFQNMLILWTEMQPKLHAENNDVDNISDDDVEERWRPKSTERLSLERAQSSELWQKP